MHLIQMGTRNLRSDRGQTIFDPAGVTPSRRMGTLVEKRNHWNKQTKSLMEGEGQARSLGNSRPNRQCAQNHRYSKVAHLSHLAKQQRKSGEDGVLASTVTSQVKARSPATRSHDKPTKDVGKRRHHSEMGGYIAKETNSNGNLCWRSIVTKDTNDPKG